MDSYPLYNGDVVTRDYEIDVVERFNTPAGTALPPVIQGIFTALQSMMKIASIPKEASIGTSKFGAFKALK